MEKKYYEVKMEICAPDKETVECWLDGMPHADEIYECNIVDPDEPYLEARIRYVEDWNGQGEYYVFENKWTNEEEWGLDVAFKLQDSAEEKGVLLHYEALTKIRELMNLGIPFYFARS